MAEILNEGSGVPLTQPIKYTNPVLNDTRLKMPGTASSNANSSRFVVPLGPIDFTGEPDKADGSRPLYWVVGGNSTDGWIFSQHGGEIPDNLITEDDLVQPTEGANSRKIPALDANEKIAAKFFPFAVQSFMGDMVITQNDSPNLSPVVNPIDGATYYVKYNGVEGPFTADLTDIDDEPYSLLLSEKDKIVWSAAFEKWFHYPYENELITDEEIIVYRPDGDTIGEYKHLDVIPIGTDIVSILKKILQSASVYTYSKPEFSVYLSDSAAYQAEIYPEVKTTDTTDKTVITYVDLGYFLKSANTARIYMGGNTVDNKDWGTPVDYTVKADIARSGSWLFGGSGAQCYYAWDENDDGVFENDSYFEQQITFPRLTSAEATSTGDPGFFTAGAEELAGIRLNTMNDEAWVEATLIFPSPAPKSDAIGRVDTTPPSSISRKIKSRFIAKKRVFAISGSNELTSEAAVEALIDSIVGHSGNATTELKLWPQKHYMTSGTLAFNMALASQKWFLIAVPIGYTLDIQNTKTTTGLPEALFTNDTYAFGKQRSIALFPTVSGQLDAPVSVTYKFYLAKSALGYESTETAQLTVKIATGSFSNTANELT